MRVFKYYLPSPLAGIRLAQAKRRPPPVPLASTPDSFAILSVSGFELPPELGLRRDIPNPNNLLDDSWLFHDAFVADGQLHLIGAPLINLWPVFRRMHFAVDGRPLKSRWHRAKRDRTEILRADVQGSPSNLSISLGSVSSEIPIQRAQPEIFRGRKVLLAKSKDNDLAWIEDWVDFHVRAQGADAVLFYDNASTRYGPTEVLDCIRSVPGIEAAVVVDWPYKFGDLVPGCNGDYAQYVILEDARRRFLADAAGVLHLDVDELVVSEGTQTAFESAAASRLGGICFVGIWIDSAREGSDSQIRHRDFRYHRKGQGDASLKWAAIPRLLPDDVQLTVHGFGKGFGHGYPSDIRLRHFRRVNTSWRHDRRAVTTYDPEIHEVDAPWVAQMKKIGWASD